MVSSPYHGWEERTVKRTMAWVMAVMWMGVIFTMSAMPGEVSGQQSGAVVALLLALLPEGLLQAIRPDTLALLVRKGAHMAEYAVLCLLLARALRLSGARRPLVAAAALSAAFAATDELHQSFVDGRSAMLTDVVIDTVGAALGALGCRAARRLLQGK